ncbi:MAG: PQQ-binding-like beta-propeller repeat protein [Phycisphaera sp.]|nr:MAG: PQQ-binding-like beta-propeller repeat protein [Phycisphaera sp.]
MRSAAVILVTAMRAIAQDAWTHAAATPHRVSIADTAVLPELSTEAWLYDAGGVFEAIPQVSPVISSDGVVVVLGLLDGHANAIALEAGTGEELWRAPVDAPVLLSWSSPALEGVRGGGFVIVTTGSSAVALDLGNGAELWRAALGQPVVNASPAIDADNGVVRLTTYDPFGGGARLLMLDAADGEVIDEVTIGSASGATPAVDGPRVFVALADGSIKAFEHDTEAWTASNPIGFFGGIAYEGGSLFAASYAFSGGRDNSNMVKLDAATGDELWAIACERTDATPIPLGDGRVVLSAGLEGFGSLPTIQLFNDRATTAERVWDLATETWDDLNADGRIDPGEYLALGGWDHQPAAIRTPDGVALLVGAPDGGLALVDLDAHPAGAEFVHARTDLGGGSPAIAQGIAVSMWGDHVVAFALDPTCFADFDGDGSLTIFDFLAFQNAFDAGDLAADCDGDGTPTIFDFLCFQNAFDAGCA